MLSKVGWKVTAAVSSLVAARVTAKAVAGGWRKVKRSDPPANPASPPTGWGEACVRTSSPSADGEDVLRATTTGAAIAPARLVARRGAAGAWRKATGHLPPGVEEVAAT